MLENLKDYKILLASKSPRRRELLSQLRIPFTVINLTDIDESYPNSIPAEDVPQFLANKKGDAYASTLRDNEIIITADTLVILDDKILGKPHDAEDAKRMLRMLSGKVHKVISGVCIMASQRRITFSTATEVKFANLSESDIEYYVSTYQPLDKAGAYGIQEWIGCIGIEYIRGSYYNVVGLPVHQLYDELKNF